MTKAKTTEADGTAAIAALDLPGPAAGPMELVERFRKEELDYVARRVFQGKPELARTHDDVAFYLWRCQLLNVDPFGGLLVPMLRANKHGPPKLAVQTTYDGFLLIADRTGRLIDISEPEFDREEGDGKPPKWCKVTVTYEDARSGRERRRTVKCLFSEFRRSTPVWDSQPWWMLALRTEAHALKRAFPEQLGDVGTIGGGDADEDQAPRQVAAEVVDSRPAPAPGRPSVFAGDPTERGGR